MIEAFHVTTEKALPGILEAGLLPQIGERSAQLGESEPAVFLFSSFENMENALWNWLGEVFDEEEERTGEHVGHVALRVLLPDGFAVPPDEMYEIAYPDAIPPENIQVMWEYEID